MMEWISVEERLPEDEREVVVWIKHEDIQGYYIGYHDKTLNRWLIIEKWGMEFPVTHWAELTPPQPAAPPPPEVTPPPNTTGGSNDLPD